MSEDGVAAGQRLVNLLAVLAAATKPVTRHYLLTHAVGYGDPNSEATTRMFERDKGRLREHGLIIDMVPTDPLSDEADGYVLRNDWQLPPVNLTPRQRIIVAMAALVWPGQSMVDAARRAAESLGAQDDAETAAPSMGRYETLFEQLFSAIQQRRRVEFIYASFYIGVTSVRHVDPWRLFCTGGNWYLVGYDLDKDTSRVFKLSRIQGLITVTAAPVANSAPGSLDVRALVAGWASLKPAVTTAVLEVDAGTCAALRAMAETVVVGNGVDRLDIKYDVPEKLARIVASTCQHVTVIQPEQLRDLVTAYVTGASHGD